MIKKYFILIIITFSFLMNGCDFYDLFVDIDTTDSISMVSYKPELTLRGDAIMSLKVGDPYVDQGCDVKVGPDSLNMHEIKIVEGNPDNNTQGVYIVKYEATNGFGWSSYAIRSVLVHDGTPYNSDISGTTWRWGANLPGHTSEVIKYSVSGYWSMTSAYAEQDVVFPIIFADNGDGINFTIVPGVHPDKGNYWGSVEYKDVTGRDTLLVSITTQLPNQEPVSKPPFKFIKY